jgi:hypothetical protein
VRFNIWARAFWRNIFRAEEKAAWENWYRCREGRTGPRAMRNQYKMVVFQGSEVQVEGVRVKKEIIKIREKRKNDKEVQKKGENQEITRQETMVLYNAVL